MRKWVRRTLVALAALLVARVAWHEAVVDDAKAIVEGRAEAELVSRRDYLSSRLDTYAEGGSPGDAQFSGEWAIVTLSMTAAGAASTGFDYPGTVPDDLALAEHACRLAMDAKARAFDTARWGSDALATLDGDDAHIGYLGHLGIVLESYRLLGGKDAQLRKLERDVVAALGRRYDSAAIPFLETYPGERYVADNAVVLAVLALSDVGGAPAHAVLLKRAIVHARGHLLDAKTGLLEFGVDERGEGTGGARASGAAWSLYYMAFADEGFAREQADALRRGFRKKLLPGAEAVCERPSCEGKGDVDSGPLLLGTSPAATGFAIAAARRLGDEQWLGGLLSTAEWVGMTVPGKRRRYLVAPLVGDAIVLAMKSSRPWDARYLADPQGR